MNKNLKIGVFGHYGNQNLGDESIIAAVIQNVRKKNSSAQLYGFSINPHDTLLRHKITSFPIRRLKQNGSGNAAEADSSGDDPVAFSAGQKQMGGVKNRIKKQIKKSKWLYFILKAPFVAYSLAVQSVDEARFLYQSYRILGNIDALFISGSNQFLDNFGGVRGFPYTLLKWTILAKFKGVKVYFISLGAGPVKSKLSVAMIRWCIRLSDYTSFRDYGSRRLIGQTGAVDTKVYPDLAFSLDIKGELPGSSTTPDGNGPLKIGINPMPVHDGRYWPIPDDEKYNRYIEKMSKLYLALKGDGFLPFFYNTQPADLKVIEDVVALIHGNGPVEDQKNRVSVKSHNTLDALLRTISTADILIPTRFHGIILSYLLDKPVAGICYGNKSKELIRDIGQGDYAYDIDGFGYEAVVDGIKDIRKNYPVKVKQIQAKKMQYGNNLKNQYETILTT